MIYLDYAATTPLDPRVLDAMLPFLRPDGLHANPASEHAPGRRARKAVEDARAQVAAALGAEPGEIVWTSGATESDNLAIQGALEFDRGRGRHVVTARTEHKAVLDTCRHLETHGVRVTYLTPGADGRVAPEQVLAALQPDTALVSLMWVNNETGAIHEIERLAPALRERGVLFHVDAAQAVGRVAIDLRAVPVDLLSLSAHKAHGPKGAGALFVRKRPRARLAPLLHGGGHEQGMRSGTLAPHQLAGMGAAFALASAERAAESVRLAALRDRLLAALAALPDIHLNAAGAPRVPGIVNVSFGGVEGESLRAGLPDLALSSGAACSAATREPSYVLRALGRDDELANASLRFSFGRFTTEAEIDAAAARVAAEVRRLRALSPLWREPSGAREGRVSEANPFGYPEAVWRRFREAPLAGRLEGGVAAEAATPANRSRLRLEVRVADARVADARFQAYGCPTTIAVGAWLAEQAVGRSPDELGRIGAPQIRAALEIPEERTHCALLGEDVIKSLVETLR